MAHSCNTFCVAGCQLSKIFSAYWVLQPSRFEGLQLWKHILLYHLPIRITSNSSAITPMIIIICNKQTTQLRPQSSWSRHHVVQHMVTNVLDKPAASIFRDKCVETLCNEPLHNSLELLHFPIFPISRLTILFTGMLATSTSGLMTQATASTTIKPGAQVRPPVYLWQSLEKVGWPV
jgi:hypothetical protein